MAPKDAHIRISGICNNVTLYGKKNFEDVIKGLEMGKLSWMSQMSPVLSKEEARAQSPRRRCEDRNRGGRDAVPQAKEYRQLLEAEEGRETAPLQLLEGMQPCRYVGSMQSTKSHFGLLISQV